MILTQHKKLLLGSLCLAITTGTLCCVEGFLHPLNNAVRSRARRTITSDKDIHKNLALALSSKEYEASSPKDESTEKGSGVVSLDVSELGLTMDDLNKPLPSEMFSVLKSSGYESTSRIPDVNDDGCQWEETAESIDVVLKIPGLRGQPAAALSVEVGSSTNNLSTCSITAFGLVVWSCLLRGKAESSSFMVEEGKDMVPIVQISVVKKLEDGVDSRWGGFIQQIGENSIL